MRKAALATALLLLAPVAARSAEQEKSVQPYIDELKEGLEPAPSEPSTTVPDPYIQSIRKKMREKGEESGERTGGQSYIDELKATDPEAGKPAPGSYIEEQKAKIGPGVKDSAIQAYHEGRSELEARREGPIHSAFGLRYGLSISHDVTASGDTGARSFNEVYGASYVPDLTLFWEWQPFHSEWFGNIGLVASGGIAIFHGPGQFRVQLTNPVTHVAFPSQSQTDFQFFTVPVVVGLDYRFNLFRILRPFIEAGPSFIGYYEARRDDRPGNRGSSKGLLVSGGVSLLLDWFGPGGAWNLYAEHGIKHYYLTVEYSRLTSFASDVSFNFNGVSAGLTFEY